MRRRVWPAVVAAVLMGAACGGTPAPQPTAAAGPANVGNVEFLSSQGQPANENQKMNNQVLAAFNGHADFTSSPTAAQDLDKITAEQKAGKGTIDVLALQHGDFTTLAPTDSLEDLTPLLQRLEKDRQFPKALLDYGKLGTQKQYYIPWLQATYMMAVNKKALDPKYLPKGVDVNNLTYDQVITWGQNIQKATGERLFGLPAAPGTQASLLHRFLQGYAYPSYTGGEVTGFKSADAVQMWQMLKRLWAVTNPQSTTYANLQDPLQSGDVWLGWDHQARLKDALEKMPDQFITVPAPRGPKGLGYMSVIVGLAIPKTAPNKAGAEALIDYLTRSSQQVAAGAALSFFPVVDGVKLTGSQVPPYLNAEAGVAAKYVANKNSVVALLPVGLGSKSDQFTLTYQDTFTRIVLHNEDIQTVLNDQATKLQDLLNAARAACWPPDSQSTGTCQIK
ncbi:MAG TPA: ABC transporter substrate-binding protein [Candidatus Dormibacteraeota bacterium]